MSSLYNILEFNKQFVENKEYRAFETTKFPNKKMVILACMDTRLTELLPHALNLKNGDAKLVKNAGAVVTHPFGSIMRSILIALYELKAEEVYVIGHLGCGMSSVNSSDLLEKMIASGIPKETISSLRDSNVDIDSWLHGFGCVYDSVKKSVNIIKNHPLMPKVPVHGLIMDPHTGELDLAVDGNLEFVCSNMINLEDLKNLKK